ncbi:circularly permuted type 2 ATP-grasp protein [Methylacidiphilum caldifontis]|uniref:circularly permuted type 2 ATP-grasp protein n=1 Tax=Methylacidiphilum caldifontis TaxID=2795386 RepID=UPI001A8DB531|nr:circularly permuted type 2 ATP-grasp protein [Methylacidiphilum caldifontis]QSR89419.1 circularly permuted type 2 ATP-grasp protein [Methylacidiphilum caldifontis]
MSKMILEKQASSLVEENLNMAQKAMGLNFELMGIYPYPLDKGEQYSIDPWPIILCEEDWVVIRAGIEQRVKGWRKFLKDLYFEKTIFKNKVIPFEPFFSSPRYRRECVNLNPAGEEYCYFFSCELAKEENGNWIVLHDELEIPQNIMLAEEIRRGLRETLPELFNGVEPLGCLDYPEKILEALSQVLPEDNEGLVALVTEKAEDWEAALLARRMGIPLFLSTDLVVLEGKLYAKTLGGLEPIAILLRRIADSRLDPIANRCSIDQGIAGLFWCLRKGNLKLVNAAGCGIVSDPLLQSYGSKIISFYLKERPLLNSLPTYPASDPDAFSLFLDSPADYILKDREAKVEPQGIDQWVDWAKAKKIPQRVLSSLVVQKRLSFKKFPSFYGSSLSYKPFSFVFYGVVKENRSELLPIVLGKGCQENEKRLLLKDVWLYQEKLSRASELTLYSLPYSENRISILSRVAESMYWLGRYLTRALQLHHIILSFWSYEDKALLENSEVLSFFLKELADYFSARAFKSSYPKDHLSLFFQFFMGSKGEDSVINCISRCFENGAKIRDSIPPEVWISLSSLYYKLQKQSFENKNLDSTQLISDFSLDSAKLLSAIDEHLLRNEQWKFFQVGRFYEKARFSILLSRFCLKLIEKKDSQGYNFLALLEKILKLSSALYAYRSLYHYPFSAHKAIALFLFDEQFSRSVSFCLDQVETMLKFIERFPSMSAKPLSIIRYLNAKLKRWSEELKATSPSGVTNTDPVFVYKPWIEQIEKELFEFHLLLTDYYFTHQSAIQTSKVSSP